MKFDDLKADYETLWSTMELKPSMAKECEWGAAKVLGGRTRYEAVSAKTGVPWFMVGLMHLMESGCDFSKHLHNGDPLSKKTVNVPKGRPLGNGPWTWDESAMDAISFDGLDKVSNWSMPRIAYYLESFNGWGYRKHHPEVKNPYLWSGCTHYVRGKYVEDPPGSPTEWKPELESDQIGSMPVLKRLCDMVPEIGFGSSPIKQPTRAAAPIMTTPESFPKANPPPPVVEALKGRTVLGQLFALGGLVVTYLGTALDNVTQIALDSVAQITKLEGVAKLSPGSKALGTGILVLGIGTAIYARLDAAKRGKTG